MPKQCKSKSAIKLRESIQSKLNLWRQTRDRTKQVPTEIRKAVITLMHNGGSTCDLHKLGISHEQAKKWEEEYANGSPKNTPEFSFATVIPKTIQLPKRTALATTESGFNLQYQNANGASLKVFAESTESAITLINEFLSQ